MNDIKNKYKALFFMLFLYFFLLFGIYNGEDALGSARNDYTSIFPVIELISEKTWYYFINYTELKLRHSPVFQFYRAFFNISFDNDFYFKIINTHINILIVLIFYKSLRVTFDKINKNNLIILSTIIFVMPSFRAYSIWPDSFMFGFIFFLLSIYFYINFKNKKSNIKKKKFALYNTLSLIIAAYISPNFGVFVIFFLYSFLKEFKFSRYFVCILVLNFLLSIPFFYYIFFLENNFLDFDGSIWVKGVTTLSINNLANKVILLPTIFIIFFLPFLVLKFEYFLSKMKQIVKKFSLMHLFITASPLLLLPFFSYEKVKLNLGGGGIFYNFFYFFEDQIFLLSIISSVSIFLILLFFYKSDSKYLDNNEKYLFIISLILTSPQLTTYIMYYELILFTGIFLFFEKKVMNEIIGDYKKIYFIIFYYMLFLGLNLLKFKFLDILEKY